jgi:hypothetical protein
MKKSIGFITQGQRANIGEGIIQQILPNKYTEAIGPFVFLDHCLLPEHLPGRVLKRINKNPVQSPTGIATITYFMKDEGDKLWYNDHQRFGSRETNKINTGNNITHNVQLNNHCEERYPVTHALQFCVNLPNRQRLRSQVYLPIEENEIPKHLLSGNRGWMKLVVGEYENLACKIESYTKQFLYHFHLEPGKKISTTTVDGLLYAIFLPMHDAVINDMEFNKGDVIEFDKEKGTIEIFNKDNVAIDIIIFGGEQCT